MTQRMIIPVWINGVPEASVPVSDRGLAYGDGVFETIRISAGQPTLAALHWSRLQCSCERLNIPLDLDLLKGEIGRFLWEQSTTTAILKIIITRGSGGRGYNPEGCSRPTRCLSLHPLPVRTPDPAFSGARVMRCETRLGRSVLAGMKHLNRLEQVLARAEWQGDDWDEGVVCDFDGYLIEGTMSNLFVVTTSGCLLTPDLSGCGVAGVCRQFIQRQSAKWGLTVNIGLISAALDDLNDLNNVAEVFLCNSVNGVWPVVQLGEQLWDIGDTTLKIRDCLLEELNA